MEKKAYTLQEVAQQLGITRRTLYNYIKAGSLTAHKIGGQWRVMAEDLHSFMYGGADQSAGA